MAGHEWEDWFEREEFIGQISDIRVQNLQVEREVVQKRTFTRWMNLHLEKCNPPMEVHDLFRDIQDGRLLMALLEELSGCKLLHGFKQSSHRIFRLNNIAKVLTFLEERNVKLVSIDAADVADGNSSIVLGLIWNIILFFQIKELTGNIKSQFPSSSSLSSIPTSSDSDTSHSSTPSEERRPSIAMRDHGKPIKTLLQWVQRRTRKYGVAVQDFGRSWTSGLAFLAVIKSIDPSLVDMRRALLRTARENLEEAFRTAHYSLGIPRLLEPEDVTINPPEEQSIMIYVSQFLEHFPGIEEPEDASKVIERSVSMGRLSSRTSESESQQARNGLYRSRERDRDRPYVVRKDWVQPPPKIFISSVSEDRGLKSPTSPPVGDRPWASRGSSVGSTTPSPVDDRPQSGEGEASDLGSEVFTVSTSNSPQPSFVDSVIGSSVIDDSAIGSPDSWMESLSSELVMPEGFAESRSDGSLCDSGVAWDIPIPPTTSEGVKQGSLPSVTGSPQDEQSMGKFFIDEGIYSLNSMESTQESAKPHSEKQEEEEKEVYRYILDLNEDGAAKQAPDKKETTNKAGNDVEQRDTSTGQINGNTGERRQPSIELNENLQNSNFVHTIEDPETEETSQSQDESDTKQVTPDHSEQPKHSVEEIIDRKTECARESVEGGQFKKVKEERLKQDTEGSETQEKMRTNVQNGHIEPHQNTATQDDVMDQGHMDQNQTSQGGPLEPGPDPKESHTVQMDSVSAMVSDPDSPQNTNLHDPTEGGEERTLSPERDRTAGDEDLVQDGSPRIQLVELSVDDLPTTNEVSNNDLNSSLQAGEPCEIPVSAPCGPGVPLPEISALVAPEKKRRAGNGQDDEVIHRSTDATEPLASDNMETVEAQQGKPVSFTPVNYPHNDMPLVIETFVEPVPEVAHSEEEPHTPQSPTYTQNHPALPDQQIEREKDTDGLPNGGQAEVKATEVEDTRDKMDSEQHRTKSMGLPNSDSERSTRDRPEREQMNLFHAGGDVDSSALEEVVGEPLDPMDLFYPDKEELTEQPESETDKLFSPFSVSALQPAPASAEPLSETHTHSQLAQEELGEDKTTRKQDKEGELNQGPVGPTDPQERCLALGEQTAGDRGVMETETQGPTEHGDLIGADEEKPTVARENMEPMSGEAVRDGTGDERLSSATPYLRKVADSNELKKSVATRQIHSTNSDSVKTPEAVCEMTVSEFYVLLLLWLLLYCLFVLPQLDVRTLPRLLLNLEE